MMNDNEVQAPEMDAEKQKKCLASATQTCFGDH
jgi:hypothetical protein